MELDIWQRVLIFCQLRAQLFDVVLKLLFWKIYYTHEKGVLFRSSFSSSANLSFTEFMIFLRNSSFLTLSGSFVVIPQRQNEFSISEESTVNQNSFRGSSILYITNFCETRKINSNAIRVLFLLLNVQKSRNCALNLDIYGCNKQCLEKFCFL